MGDEPILEQIEEPSLDSLNIQELLILKDGMIRKVEDTLLSKDYEEYKKASNITNIIQFIIDKKLDNGNT
jgi:hypothetical protein